jgi:Cation transporter/ATPase, N-terminus
MDAASKVKSASDVSTWHAMTADEVIKRLNTDAKNGLDADEGRKPAAEVRIQSVA